MKRWALGALLVIALSVAGLVIWRHEAGPMDPEGTLGPLVSEGSRQAQELPQLSVATDDLAQVGPPVLADRVSLDDVLSSATAGAAAEDGETFALMAMVYLGDDQNGDVGPREIATLVAADDRPTAEYIYTQMGIPETLGLDPAQMDTSLQPWVRTQIMAPDRVRTGLTMFVRYPELFEKSDGMWVRYVTESVYANGAWQLTSWNNFAGPNARQLSSRDLDNYFDAGKGWRRATFA